jgi:hypothetical protein
MLSANFLKLNAQELKATASTRPSTRSRYRVRTDPGTWEVMGSIPVGHSDPKSIRVHIAATRIVGAPHAEWRKSG